MSAEERKKFERRKASFMRRMEREANAAADAVRERRLAQWATIEAEVRYESFQKKEETVLAKLRTPRRPYIVRALSWLAGTL